jgi:hypothetical protein
MLSCTILINFFRRAEIWARNMNIGTERYLDWLILSIPALILTGVVLLVVGQFEVGKVFLVLIVVIVFFCQTIVNRLFCYFLKYQEKRHVWRAIVTSYTSILVYCIGIFMYIFLMFIYLFSYVARGERWQEVVLTIEDFFEEFFGDLLRGLHKFARATYEE